MIPVVRDRCVITSSDDLELIYTFKKFPVFMGCVEKANESEDLKMDMNFFISKKSGIIQLNPLVPLEILYNDSHGSGSIGNLWQKHHQAFADFISKYGSKNIFEIGGGHGVLAKQYLERTDDAIWTILEANPSPEYIHPKINFKKGVFDEHYEIDNTIDTIVHSHLFEHVYDPKSFVMKLYKSLPVDGYTIFSVPFLEQHIKENITYCLGFEHTLFLTEIFIEYFLRNVGFEIIEKSIYDKNHSIFYCAQKKDKCTKNLIFPDRYNEYFRLFKNYFKFNEDKVNEFNRRINKTDDKIYLFGAHAASQYLINYGLDISKIEMIIDNDPKKHNKRLYGTKLIVKSPKILQNKDKVIVILRQGVFNEEIKKDILTNINENAVFWE